METAARPHDTRFGELLREWRRFRGKSQFALALEASVSPRHVSFLETSRARPSRQMVITLATTLDVPLRERNVLLSAAGFAPLYRESELSAPELAPARQALELISVIRSHTRPSSWTVVEHPDGEYGRSEPVRDPARGFGRHQGSCKRRQAGLRFPRAGRSGTAERSRSRLDYAVAKTRPERAKFRPHLRRVLHFVEAAVDDRHEGVPIGRRNA